MNMQITERKNNALLSRIEVKGKLDSFVATPSNKDITGRLAKELGKSEDAIAIQGIYTKFNMRTADFTAHAYESAEAKANVELKLGKKAVEKMQKGQKKEAPAEAKPEGA